MNAFAAWLAYSGLTALAFGMSRHHRAVFQQELPGGRRTALRLTGWMLLAASFVAACLSHGAEIGSVAWFATVAAAGLGLTGCLAERPRLWRLTLAGMALLALL